jgi:hypothetical protein
VTGTTAALSVLGASSAGEAGLTYTWSVIASPSGAPAPSFSRVGPSNAAKNTTVTFARAGSYTFRATIANSSGSVTSNTTATVNATLTSIAVSPGSTSVADGNTQSFSAAALDQFSVPLTSQPTVTWSVLSGLGTVNASGLYTAPSTGTGTATVRALSGSVSGTASVTVTAANDGTIDYTADGTGTAVANSTFQPAIWAFDNNLSTKWVDNIPGGAYIQYQFPNGAAYAINKYTITSGGDNS